MSKLKTWIWIVIVILLMVLFFQNQSGFMAKRSLRLNLYVVSYQTPSLPDGLYFLGTLVIGLVLAYFFSLPDRFKSRKTIKNLTSSLAQNSQEMIALKKEIDVLKQDRSADQQASVQPGAQAQPSAVVFPENGPKPEADSRGTIDAEPEQKGSES